VLDGTAGAVMAPRTVVVLEAFRPRGSLVSSAVDDGVWMDPLRCGVGDGPGRA